MKKLLATLLAVLMLTSCVACGSTGSDVSEDAAEKCVVVYASDIFNTLDPFATTANSDQAVFDQVYETLAQVQNDGSVAPCLAESWTVSDDAKTYTFSLVKGAKFHNGEEMKASDVVFSYNLALSTASKENFVRTIESVVADDDYTVTIQLKSVTPLFLVYTNEIPIISEKFYNDVNGDINSVACGTGPYELVSIDFATSAMLKSFADYRLGEADIKAAEIRYVGDESTAEIQLESGDLDFMRLSPSYLVNLEGNDEFNIAEVPTLKTAIVALNNTVKPLDNKLVRQALSCAMNRDDIISAAYDGYAVPARFQASDKNCFGVDFSDAEDFSYNPERAKELLKEAGYENGLNLTADYGVYLEVFGGQLEKAAVVFQQNLADVGVTLELKNTSTPDEQCEGGEFAMMVQTLSYRADFSYNECHYATSGIGGNNFCQLSDPYIDEMFEKYNGETDEATRLAGYKELIAYISDLCPNLTMYWPELIFVNNVRVNVVPRNTNNHQYYLYEWSWNV